MQAAYDLKFEEEPDYEKLRFLLLMGLLEHNDVPTQDYDWIYNPIMRTGVLRRLGDNISSASVELEPEAEIKDEEDHDLVTKIKHYTAKANSNALKDKQ